MAELISTHSLQTFLSFASILLPNNKVKSTIVVLLNLFFRKFTFIGELHSKGLARLNNIPLLVDAYLAYYLIVLSKV